jgi:predicted outer membrane protein
MAMRIALVLVILTASAHAEPEKATPAETAAKAWLATLLDAKANVPAPSKDKPFDYVIDSPAKSCRTLKSGHATTAAAGSSIKKCVIDTWKSLADTPTPSAPIREWELEASLGGFDRKYHKAMKETAKDAMIVQAEYIGSGFKMTALVVLAKDGTVHAIWMRHGEFE